MSEIVKTITICRKQKYVKVESQGSVVFTSVAPT